MRYYIGLKKSGSVLWEDDQEDSIVVSDELSDSETSKLCELLTLAEHASSGGFRSRGIPPQQLAHSIATELSSLLSKLTPFSSETVIRLSSDLASALSLPDQVVPASEFISQFGGDLYAGGTSIA